MKFAFILANRFMRFDKGSKFLSLISFITTGGIAIGVTVLIMAISILAGFEEKIGSNIIKFNAHINISGFSSKNLKDHHLIEQKLKNQLDGIYESFSPYVSHKVIISKRNLAEGILLNGIDSAFLNNSLSQIITTGKSDLDENGIVIGNKLANKFSVDVGDKIAIFTINNNEPPSLNNLPDVEQFEITAIFESGMAEYDDTQAFINFDTAVNFFEFEDEVSGYNINLKNPSLIDSVKYELSDILSYPFYVRSYRDINKHIFTWLELQQKPIPIVLGLIIIVAVFNIVGAILMLVIQKTEAIGVLRSIGANSKQIVQIFVIQGLTLSLIGILLGNILSFGLSILQNYYQIISLPQQIYYLSSVPIDINPYTYLLVSGIGLALSLIISFIPSYIAARIKPITAIKFN